MDRDAVLHAHTLTQALHQVQERMAKAMRDAGRTGRAHGEGACGHGGDLSLVAISKLQPSEAVRAVAQAGQVDFGENYLQEALTKKEELATHADCTHIRWHFTGHVQSRKAKDVVGNFTLIHTLDSLKLAQLLDRHAAEKGLRQSVLIQVNVGEEVQKSGVTVAELPQLAEAVAQCPHLDLQGLMCLPPVFDAGLAARPYFALLRELRAGLRTQLSLPLPHLSMGMSGDLEAAVLEGATLVRVGTDIFGSRMALQ